MDTGHELWIDICRIVPHGAVVNSYAASDLFAYASLTFLAGEARDRGEDPRHLQ